MKVKELIRVLLTCSPCAEVRLVDRRSDVGETIPITAIGTIEEDENTGYMGFAAIMNKKKRKKKAKKIYIA